MLNRRIVRHQLETKAANPFAEEYQNPWQDACFPFPQMPLLRIWDGYSGSQPEDDHRMMSRAPEMRLDSAESRKESLAKHLNHKCWEPGPYISFTTSPAAIERLAQMRAAKRGVQTLTVIDPNVRVRNGLPILSVKDQMRRYDIPDPYRRSNEYYIDHYVCLWQVTQAEIVRHWHWSSLADNERWYEEIILPAFKNFAASKAAADNAGCPPSRLGVGECAKEEVDDLQDIFKKLSGRLSLQLVCIYVN